MPCSILRQASVLHSISIHVRAIITSTAPFPPKEDRPMGYHRGKVENPSTLRLTMLYEQFTSFLCFLKNGSQSHSFRVAGSEWPHFDVLFALQLRPRPAMLGSIRGGAARHHGARPGRRARLEATKQQGGGDLKPLAKMAQCNVALTWHHLSITSTRSNIYLQYLAIQQVGGGHLMLNTAQKSPHCHLQTASSTNQDWPLSFSFGTINELQYEL